MSLFDKIKNLLTEEEEDEATEEIKVEQIKKESKKRKLEQKEELENIEETKEIDVKIEDKKEEVKPIIKEEKPTREKIKKPAFFTDDDFEDLDANRVKKQERHVEQKSNLDDTKKLYNGAYSSTGYTNTSILKKEKSTFKPSPVISPVYGVLGGNYSKEDIVEKSEKSSYTTSPSRRDKFDEVRNKAYGTLENELEDAIFLDELNKSNSDGYNTVSDINAIKYIEDDEDLVSSVTEQDKKMKSLEEVTMDLTKELDNLLLKNDSFEEKKEIISNNKDDDELSENELFNLIDSMYSEGKE